MWPSSVRPGLSPEDEEVKRKLVKCAPCAYSKLIRSDILGPSGARPTRLPFLRPSPFSVIKPSLPPVSKSSVLEPFMAKPTWGELRARLEVLAKKKRSVKAKVASLTSERARLQAQIRDLTEELVKHRSNWKHASTARARVEDKEKKAERT